MNQSWTFAKLQLAQAPLMLLGVPVIAVMAALKRYDGVHWKDKWMYVWDNDQDGIVEPGQARTWPNVFQWSAIRNSTHNFSNLAWVVREKATMPLWYKTWFWFGRQFYWKAGKLASGYLCLSFGGGKGF